MRASESVEIASSAGTLSTAGPLPDGLAVGDGVLVIINERSVSIAPVHHEWAEMGIKLSGVMNEQKFRGGESEIHMTVGRSELVSIVPTLDAQTEMTSGDEVSVLVPPEAVTLLPSAEA